MKDKKRTYKPEKQTVRLTERLLPELKDLDVGKTATITLKVRMTSKTQGDEYGNLSAYCCDEDDCTDSEYDKARAKDRAQLRGTFEIVEADEVTKSSAQIAAEKIMADKRKPRVI
jgi:hypothetical protein